MFGSRWMRAVVISALLPLWALPVAAADVLRVGGTGGATAMLEQLGHPFTRLTGIGVRVIPSLGSSGGIKAVAAGVLDVAVSGRSLLAEEQALGLVTAITTRTPFVLATSHPRPPAMMASEVIQAYSSDHGAWPDGSRIKPVLRPRNDSESIMLANLFPGMDAALKHARQRSDLPVAATDQDSADLAEKLPGSLTSATYTQIVLERRDLRLITIDGVPPTIEAFETGAYPTPNFSVSFVPGMRVQRPSSSSSSFEATRVCWRYATPAACPGPSRAATMRMPPIRTLLNGFGILIAGMVALAAPMGYLAVGLGEALGTLTFKAQLNADRVAKYVFTHNELWQYQSVRLAELIELPAADGSSLHQRITDAQGIMVLDELDDIEKPVLRFRARVIVEGEVVGWLEAKTSIRPVLVGTAWTGAASSVPGLLAWLAVRLFPLRVLDRTLAQLSMQSARFQAALDNMTQGLCLFDAQGGLVVHNQRFATMFGTPIPNATAATLLADRRLSQILSLANSDRDSDLGGTAIDLPDGRAIQVARQPIPGAGWVATYEDVTERRRSREQLTHMARHDALTGLPNRVKFREHLEHVLLRERRGGGVTVLYLDLDGFKGVNDALGHSSGDELLGAVASRLQNCIRETDLVVRLGGDEFAIVQADVQQPLEATALSTRLIEALRAPFEIGGHHVAIGTSIGIALAEKAATPDGLLHNADIALYRAKADGRGTMRFFEPEMDIEMQARRTLEADLRRALAAGDFEVFYQPLIEAETEVLTGFEALVRWNHPARGLVPPAGFIPLAEETGLIRSLGAWVLGQACTDAEGWPKHIKVAVNLSPVQFLKGNLVREVEQALATSGLMAPRLELEITESVLLQDSDATLGILHRLRGLGVRISMDDFGTGYSSLSYLRRFPFDKIKIDQSFVRTLATERGSVEIIRAVVGLGRALSMQVLAEGVETVEQLRALQAEGCNEVQGYLFSRPRPLRNVPEIIARYVPGESGKS